MLLDVLIVHGEGSAPTLIIVDSHIMCFVRYYLQEPRIGQIIDPPLDDLDILGKVYGLPGLDLYYCI